MTTIEILAVIGGITVILTAAAKIPAALAGLIRACVPVADAVRELRRAVTRQDPSQADHACKPQNAHTEESGNEVASARRTS